MILNIYKETNWTSFDVVAKLRGILHTKKIGHAGTLDPLAEGVLIVVTDQDTRKQDMLMGKTKEYVAEIGFGLASPTWDLEALPEFVNSIPSEEAIINALSSFTGVIQQKIPMYSAKKVQGKELYKYARQGKSLETPLPLKEVTVHEFEVISIENREVNTTAGETLVPVLTCKIVCSSGTYIRSIAHELGEKLGTDATLLKLVRTKVGEYSVESAVRIEELALKQLPRTD